MVDVPAECHRGQNAAAAGLELACPVRCGSAYWILPVLSVDAPTVVKIGVIAPFEGVGRQLGYAILARRQGELASVNGERPLGHYRVALVALNDDLDPGEAAAQARALAQDPDVLAVIGLWSDETAGRQYLSWQKLACPPCWPSRVMGLDRRTISLCPDR